MTQVTTPEVTTATEVTTTATPAAPAAPAAPKAPSKKSLAVAIFAAKLVERTQGLFASNKEFRAAVLTSIQTDLGVSTASAATMYNACKTEAEAADAAIALGRDPKKEKVASTGKRGRPAGSHNKAKEEAPAAEVSGVADEAVAEVAVAEPVAAEATA